MFVRTVLLAACLSTLAGHEIAVAQTLPDEGGQPSVQQITLDEAKLAPDALIEESSFLGSDPCLQPLRTLIQRENKNASLAKSATTLIYEGYLLREWIIDTKRGEFRYSARTQDSTCAYLLSGNFVRKDRAHWSAKLTGASRTQPFNFFGEREYKIVKDGMSVAEVTKIFGAPPGAYVVGSAKFEFHEGRKFVFYAGAAKAFERYQPKFFLQGFEGGTRAWVSNDLAIWIQFDNTMKVTKKWITVVGDYYQGPGASAALNSFVEKAGATKP